MLHDNNFFWIIKLCNFDTFIVNAQSTWLAGLLLKSLSLFCITSGRAFALLEHVAFYMYFAAVYKLSFNVDSQLQILVRKVFSFDFLDYGISTNDFLYVFLSKATS